jgi:hypothetical protein
MRLRHRKPGAACARTEHARAPSELNPLILYLSAQTVIVTTFRKGAANGGRFEAMNPTPSDTS